MGVRLYNPATGRFLSVDPVPGSSANAYDYCNDDPINHYDLDGKWWHWHRYYRKVHRRISNWGRRHRFVRVTYYAFRRWGGRVSCNHYVRQCAWWGGAGAGPVIAYGFWSGPVDWGLAGVTGGFGCVAGMGSYRWG